MTAIIAALLANPLFRKIALYALIAAAAVAAFFAFIKHYEAVGAKQAIKAQQAADAAWMVGANQNMDQAQAQIAPLVQALNEARSKNAVLESETARLSAKNDGLCGVNAAGVERLRRAGAKPQGAR